MNISLDFSPKTTYGIDIRIFNYAYFGHFFISHILIIFFLLF